MKRNQVWPSRTSNNPQAESRFHKALFTDKMILATAYRKYTGTSSDGPIEAKVYEGFNANVDETTCPA